MLLKKEAYIEYQKIYRDETGIELPMDQVIQHANAFLGLFSMLSKHQKVIDPVKKGELK